MSNFTKTYIFDIRIDNFNKKKIIQIINLFVNDKVLHQITTINPEFLLESRKNFKFYNILNSSDLNIADGVGVKFAFWKYGWHLKNRYSGIDLMWDILKISNDKNLRVYLVANKHGLSTWQETKDAILIKYPKLRISGANLNISNTKFPKIDADVLFVNFGVPFQEYFINRAKESDKISASLGVGVGGSFDYITKKIPRAPKYMRMIGLEWLYRLIQQPQRFKRIIQSIIVFPIIVLFTTKYRQKHK